MPPTAHCRRAICPGDAGYSFVRAWKDQPQASLRVFLGRQGGTHVYVSIQGDSENHLVLGEGLEALISELKKIDNKSLLASASP